MAAKRVIRKTPRKHRDTRDLPDEALVRIGEVSDLTSLSESTIRNRLSMRPVGNIPLPVPKNGRPGVNLWLLGVVRAWVRKHRPESDATGLVGLITRKAKGPEGP